MWCDISVCKFTENMLHANRGICVLTYYNSWILLIVIIPLLKCSSWLAFMALSAFDTSVRLVPISVAMRVILMRMVLGPYGSVHRVFMNCAMRFCVLVGQGCHMFLPCRCAVVDMMFRRFILKIINSSDMCIMLFLSIATVWHVVAAVIVAAECCVSPNNRSGCMVYGALATSSILYPWSSAHDVMLTVPSMSSVISLYGSPSCFMVSPGAYLWNMNFVCPIICIRLSELRPWNRGELCSL